MANQGSGGGSGLALLVGGLRPGVDRQSACVERVFELRRLTIPKTVTDAQRHYGPPQFVVSIGPYSA